MRSLQSPVDKLTTPPARLRMWWRQQPLWAKVVGFPLVTGFASMSLLLIGLRFAPLPDESLVSPTHIDSADGQTLAEWTLKGTRAQHVPLDKIPVWLQEATIAVEDVNFYRHHAFNPLSIARALWVDVCHGKIVQGGSTITQQLAKNLFLNQHRTLVRKIKEALYAMQLELHESKRTILEQYLNTVYYGHGAYGVEAASRLYFNKPVSALTLPECALLAGLPKGPSLYSPITHFPAAKTRQKVVLDRMVAAGYLTQAQANLALQAPIHLTTAQQPAVKAPYFTNLAVREVEQRYHLPAEALYQGGITITTTLDPLLQQAAERAIATTLPKDRPLQAALVALDPKTGAIRAMVGGRDYATSPYNRVFAQRQPGSAFKAVLYTAALASGWNPARQVKSELTTFLYDEDRLYTVHDFDDVYAHRPITLREAIARSDNVYAVTANLDTGPDNVIAMARRMGITSPLAPYPSLALGVCPTSPLEMACAFAVLANGGYRVTPYAVEEVRASRQETVYQTQPAAVRVLSPQVAFQMTDLLTSVFQPSGTGYSVRRYLHGMAAAKTGTTNTDNWMVGYTPNLVCAVWVGYDDDRPLSPADAHLAAPIWAKFMGTAQQHLPYAWYTPPDGLVKRTIDPVTAKLATDACRDTETDYFIPGTEPKAYCPLHPAEPAAPEHNGWWSNWLHRWFGV